MPCWHLRHFGVHAGCLDNVVLYSSVDVLKGWLDSFSFGCLNIGVMQSGVHSIAPCLEHICAGGGGGGSVVFEGFVLCTGGDYTL